MGAPLGEDALQELLFSEDEEGEERMHTRDSLTAALGPFEHSQVSVLDCVADAPYVDELAHAEVAECVCCDGLCGGPGRHVNPACFVRCMHSIVLLSHTHRRVDASWGSSLFKKKKRKHSSSAKMVVRPIVFPTRPQGRVS